MYTYTSWFNYPRCEPISQKTQDLQSRLGINSTRILITSLHNSCSRTVMKANQILSPLIVFFFSFITFTSALPTKHLRYSLMAVKQYHPFNYQLVQVMGDKLFLTSEQMRDPFKAMVDDVRGTLEMDNYFLAIKSDGTLTAALDIHTDPEHKLQTAFSLKDGILSHNGLDEFTGCLLEDGTYTLHSSQTTSTPCKGRMGGIQLKVVNEMGISPKDFDAPEFLYNTGRVMFF